MEEVASEVDSVEGGVEDADVEVFTELDLFWGVEAGDWAFELDKEANDLEVWEGGLFEEGKVRPADWKIVDTFVGGSVDEEVVVLVEPVGEGDVLGFFLAFELAQGFVTEDALRRSVGR